MQITINVNESDISILLQALEDYIDSDLVESIQRASGGLKKVVRYFIETAGANSDTWHDIVRDSPEEVEADLSEYLGI